MPILHWTSPLFVVHLKSLGRVNQLMRPSLLRFSREANDARHRNRFDCL